VEENVARAEEGDNLIPDPDGDGAFAESRKAADGIRTELGGLLEAFLDAEALGAAEIGPPDEGAEAGGRFLGPFRGGSEGLAGAERQRETRRLFKCPPVVLEEAGGGELVDERARSSAGGSSSETTVKLSALSCFMPYGEKLPLLPKLPIVLRDMRRQGHPIPASSGN